MSVLSLSQSPDASVTVYGIRTCSSVQRARAELEAHAIPYQFIDVTLHTPDLKQLQTWGKELGLDNLFNRKSTTWRNLSTSEQENSYVEEHSYALLRQYPKLLKRPVVVWPTSVSLGLESFTDQLALYLNLFQAPQ